MQSRFLRSSALMRPRARALNSACFHSLVARYTTEPERPPNPLPRMPDDKSKIGIDPVRAGLLFALTGAGLYAYFEYAKKDVQRRKEEERAQQKIGTPKIGGEFNLVDHENRPFTEANLLGRWSVLYFGFTNCPDICPDELDKMSLVLEDIKAAKGVELQPIFVTCDPARDDPAAMKAYIEQFHPSLIGLTGTYDEVKKACKAYRVYFSTPPNAKATDDYLVDHSIFFYLMDPHGKFVDAFGRSVDREGVTLKVKDFLDKYEQFNGQTDADWAKKAYH